MSVYTNNQTRINIASEVTNLKVTLSGVTCGAAEKLPGLLVQFVDNDKFALKL